MMLQYRDLANLRTKKIVFEEVIAARDSATLEHLKELSSKRRVIEDSINKTTSITEAIAREISGGLTSPYEQERLRLEQYMPLLENFISHVDLVKSNRQMIQWISQLKIQWSSALGQSSFFNIGPKFFRIDNLQYELGMMLFLYGVILRERAWEILSEDLKQSAFVFREAAGVFHHLAHEVLPYLYPANPEEMPAEATPAVSNAMMLICLADAQAVYIRKAEETGNTGAGVLAKLYYGVANMLNEAITAAYDGIGECRGISTQFLDFMSSCIAFHELRSQRYFAEGLKNDSQIGTAIGVLRDALTEVKKKMPREDSLRAVFGKEIENVTDILRKFEHENEFVWHEKITTGDELPSPQGSRIVEIQPYHPKKWERELAFKL